MSIHWWRETEITLLKLLPRIRESLVLRPAKTPTGRAAAVKQAKEHLEEKGWETFRTAGTSGRVDLIAVLPESMQDHPYLPTKIRQARLLRIETCLEKDLDRYRKKKTPGVELWIKVQDREYWESLPLPTGFDLTRETKT